MYKFPSLALVEQEFDSRSILEVKDKVCKELDRIFQLKSIPKGKSVAVTAGSRGIDRIADIIKAICERLKELGMKPFVVPAMGSHGGATEEGQKKLLASYGITDNTIGAPVRSSMETVCLGQTVLGTPVYLDKLAHEADYTVPVNRVKAHTKFKAKIESGLMKMLAIGLGKHKGASELHKLAVQHSMEDIILQTARYILSQKEILFGLGIVENAFGQIFDLKALLPEELEAKEEALLKQAKEQAAKIPFSELDLLIVDRIGKEISGTGMDTNVTGRNRDILGDFCTSPKVKRILVRDLSEETGGNALGLGLADFCTLRAVQAMDREKTYTNAMTALSPEKVAIPMHFENDRLTIQAALDSLGHCSAEGVRLVRIADTLHLSRLLVSCALFKELPANCRVLSEFQEMSFNQEGNLTFF